MAVTRRIAVASIVFVAALMATHGPSAGATRIGPHQHFVGVVNGRVANATVDTVCAGPASPGRLGPVASGQTFAVRHVLSGGGNTGLFSQVYVWFVPNSSVNGHVAVKLTTYGTNSAIPSTARVPCDGTGQVEFSACPYLAPCAAGWVPTYVTVRFVDIAA